MSRLFWVTALAVPQALAAQEPVVPLFVNETATANLATPYLGDWEFMVGGGVATFDCSGDGLPELFLAGGAAPSGLYLNQSAIGGPLEFSPLPLPELLNVTGAWPLDIDSDGITDLAVMAVGANRLLRGSGDCVFEDATAAWGFDPGDAWSASFAAAWEEGQSWPTLAVGNYVNRYEDLFPWGSCTDNWLHRPAEAGGYAQPLPLTPSYCALSLLFTDWNRSGQPALRVSNDREYYKGGQEQMWHLEPGQPPRLYTEAEGWARLRIWGMGIAQRDITGDGLPEYYLTSMADNRLQTLAQGPERPAYSDIAFARGVTAHRPYTGGDIRPSTAWHTQFEDVNADGLPDIFVVKGNVAEMPDFAQNDPNNLLLQRPDGTFLEAGELAGVASMAIGRGGALADLNLDGLLDMVVQNRWSGAEIWRNSGPGGHWLQFRLEQDGPNRDGIGAIVELRTQGGVQTREITVGGGHGGGHLGWWHFGLGAATGAEIRVTWPHAAPGPWQPVPADGFVVLRPGEDPARWVPGQP